MDGRNYARWLTNAWYGRFHHDGNVDMNHLTTFQYWVVYLIVPSVAFGLFVFLSCVLVPSQKKQAAMLVVTLSVIFVGYGIYQHYIDNGFLPNQYIIRYTGFMAGLAIGFVAGYQVYKENKWTRS